MNRYTQQIAIEAVSVGALTVGGFIVVRGLLPESSIVTHLLVTGAVLHLTLQGLGINKWY
jgi:hypothetical protein